MIGFGGAKELTCEPTFGLRHFEFLSFAPLLQPAFAVFVCATLLRLLAFKVVLVPFSSVAVGASKADAKMRRKFQEASWRAVLYATACAFAFKTMVLPDLDWMKDSELFWKGWPAHEVTSDMNALYALYVGLYIHQLVFLFIDTRSSDFVQLIIHHAITLFIVFASWLVGFTRVGSFTMVLHDCSDVFLELAKCFNYCQKQHPKLSTGADVTFVIFAVSFFYLRLYIYPTRVVASAAFTACQHVTCVPPPYLLADCMRNRAWLIFIPMLMGLQLLQVFWGYKILGVIATVIRGKPLEDPREDKDD